MSVPIIFSQSKNQNTLVIYHNPTGAATFDPTITTSVSTTVYWKTENGVTVTTGTTHNLSYTPTAGPKKCEVSVIGGLGIVSAIDMHTDLIFCIKNLSKLGISGNFLMYDNSALSFGIFDVPRKAVAVQAYSTALYGDIAACPPAATTFYAQLCANIYGDIKNLPATLINLDLHGCAGITGALNQMVCTNAQVIWLYSTVISAGSISHLVAIRDIRIHSLSWNQEDADLVISSAWGARASYTYSAISMQIGGTNAAPSGSLVAPVEGSDWHNDGAKWIPLTGKAMIYDLLNDVNSEGFRKWFSISTS